MIYAWKRDEKKRPKLTEADYLRFMNRKLLIDQKIQDQIKEAEDQRAKEPQKISGVYV